MKKPLTDLPLPAALEEEFQLAFHDLAKRRGLSGPDLMLALAREAGSLRLDAAQLRVALLNETRNNMPAFEPVLRESDHVDDASKVPSLIEKGLESVKRLVK